MPDEIEVVVQLPSGEDVLAGRLWTHRRRGAESASFTYDPGYISSPAAYALDPAMDLSLGQFQTAPGRALFGAFADSAPDRWGRRLIARGEQRLAEAGGRAPCSFGEADYLLGVRDDLRQGAIRFRRPGTVEYFADDHTGVPALDDLPALLSAAERLDRDEASDADLAALLRGGSSLGGARPKAHVHDGRGALAIAKFPSPANDDWDVTRWEAVALELAARAGIDVPAARLEAIDGKAVLIIRRFDRDDDRRLGYISAMTMLEAADGDQRSYTEIAAIIEEQSPDPSVDLHQLWRRIAFNIADRSSRPKTPVASCPRPRTGCWSAPSILPVAARPSGQIPVRDLSNEREYRSDRHLVAG